MKTWK